VRERAVLTPPGRTAIIPPEGGGVLGKNRAVRLAFGLALLTAAFAAPAHASVILSKAEDVPSASRARSLEDAREALARNEVAIALAAHGLSAEEIDQRLNRLSDEDLRLLASNLDQIQAAGDVPKYIWILLAVFLAVSILVIIF
jgi:hypothetical protein